MVRDGEEGGEPVGGRESRRIAPRHAPHARVAGVIVGELVSTCGGARSPLGREGTIPYPGKGWNPGAIDLFVCTGSHAERGRAATSPHLPTYPQAAQPSEKWRNWGGGNIRSGLQK